MRSKRLPTRRGSARRPATTGDDPGQVLDWLGLQFTGGGGVSAAWAALLMVLMALRAAPYLVGRAVRGQARRR